MLLFVTAAAIGMGWLSGGYLKGVGGPVPVPVAPENEGSVLEPAAAESPGAGPTLVALAPIVTNLASPADTWIRIEASVVYDGAAAAGNVGGNPPRTSSPFCAP